MIISPFTPLFFIGHRTDGIESEYVQIFSSDDRILIEVICSYGEAASVKVYNEPGHSLMSTPGLLSHTLNSSSVLRYVLLNLPPGYYSVEIGDKCSEPFKVTDSPDEIEDTVLIQYSPADNRVRRDVVAFVDSQRLVFSLRLPGGFKDSGYSFSVDNEQFVTEFADIIELYGMESEQKNLTIGTSAGVPIWVGQILNRLLTCKYVYIDGVRHTRFESSVPQKEQVLEGVNSFVFTQTLQEVKYIKSSITDII